MPDFSVDDISIEPDEYYFACNSRERKELIKLIKEDDLLEIQDVGRGYDAFKFQQSLEKLMANRHRLTSDEENLINKIADRL
jgi:hypothetical protein